MRMWSPDGAIIVVTIMAKVLVTLLATIPTNPTNPLTLDPMTQSPRSKLWLRSRSFIIYCAWAFQRRPHRLVVRTSRCGRDNPGSTPGVDILLERLSLCTPQRNAWLCQTWKQNVLAVGKCEGENFAHKTPARQLEIKKATENMASMTLWPSGLRRWLKAPFRKGVGSNPTGVTFYTTPSVRSPRNVDGH